MVVPVLRSRRMVPGPESISSLVSLTSNMTEHELRSMDGTQVPDPRTVTIMSGFSMDISKIRPLNLSINNVLKRGRRCRLRPRLKNLYPSQEGGQSDRKGN